MRRITFTLILLCAIGCSQKSDGIKTGTFEIYENDSLVGKIYRLGNFQIEKYPEGNELIARIDHKTDSTYLLKGIEKKENGIDSIIWMNLYQKIEKDKYKIIATPFNSEIEYKYEGVLLKINDEVEEKIMERLILLNEK